MMSIIYRYWIREFLRYFVLVQVVVGCIFVLVDYLSHLDQFFRAGVSLVYAFGYVLLKTPYMAVQFTPAAVVLAVIVVFGLMNRNNELLALKGSGISIYYLVKPAAVAGTCLALMMFFLGETLVPMTMSRANHIKYNVIKKNKQIYSVKEDIWIKGDQKIAHFRFFDPATNSISGISVTFFDPDFTMIRRIDAAHGTFVYGTWHLGKVLEQRFGESWDANSVTIHDSMLIDLDIAPEDLERIARKSEEMSYTELSAYITKVEKEGYDATVYRVDLYGKTAFPFICLIMAITGAAAGMRPSIKENMPLGITIGLGVSFGYWTMFGFCSSLGYGRVLPPFFAAWATNLFFLCFSLLYLVLAEDL